MIFRIPAGKHRARPFRFGIWWNRSHFSWVVKFDESCRYNLGNEDQLDVNKLVGIGYLWHHHKDSARFGWRYDVETDKVILSAYCYVNGRRAVDHICYCEIGKEYDLNLKILGSCYYLSVHERGKIHTVGFAWVDHYHSKRLQYRLGLYFGGNQKAPHEIRVDLKSMG